MDNYWQQEINPWQQGIRNLGTALAQIPQRRAAAAAQQQHTAYVQSETEHMRADTGLATARTGQVDAQTQDLLRKGQLVDALQKFGPQAERAMVEGRFDDPAIDQFNGAVAGLTGVNKDDIGAQVKKGMGTLLASMGKTGTAAAVENPNAAYKTDQDNASRQTIAGMMAQKPMNVSPGGAVFDPKTGGKVFQNPSAAAENDQYETTTETIPAVEAKDAVPARTEGSLWWKKQIPEEPAVAGHGEKKITRKVRLGEAMKQKPESGSQKTETPPATATPNSQGKVKVIHPSGQPGFIPAEQVQDALAQGYKLAQ